MSGCQRCLECGCLAVSDVLCADVWLSAMSCVRLSGCQRCLVCGCLAVIDVLCATGDCVLKQCRGRRRRLLTSWQTDGPPYIRIIRDCQEFGPMHALTFRRSDSRITPQPMKSMM